MPVVYLKAEVSQDGLHVVLNGGTSDQARHCCGVLYVNLGFVISAAYICVRCSCAASAYICVRCSCAASGSRANSLSVAHRGGHRSGHTPITVHLRGAHFLQKAKNALTHQVIITRLRVPSPSLRPTNSQRQHAVLAATATAGQYAPIESSNRLPSMGK
jgi:hypothetical protein